MSYTTERKIRYSEIFGTTFQGEGVYTGKITQWVRLFGCNLECMGFGQDNPNQPDTWSTPYQEVDASTITKMEDLPVFEVGCDSGYSWSKQFRHLARENTPTEIASMLTNLNVSEYNPDGKWIHGFTNQPIHLCFTGGEPMMQQDAIIAIMESLLESGNYPKHVTIETNGTQKLSDAFIQFWSNTAKDIELTFSLSPKLQSVSGELPKKAWKPDVIQTYLTLSLIMTNGKAYCKFVVNDTEESFDEIIHRTRELNNMRAELNNMRAELNLPSVEIGLYAMPVGATLEEQEQHNTKFYDELIRMGFNISDRVHVRVYGNVVGK